MTELPELVARHGYWIVAAAVGLESLGIPLPGETMLVSAAIYAGATHQLNIVIIIILTTIAAILGDNAGFSIGRRFGLPLLLRFGRWFRLTTARIKLGQYLFLRHGGKVVFWGRFMALLRTFAAVLAGVNQMPRSRFLVCNAAGAILWTTAYGTLAYQFGERIERFTGRLGIALGVGAVIVAIAGFRFVRRHEARLHAEAEQMLPGPIQPPRYS